MKLLHAGFGMLFLSFLIVASCKDNNPAQQYGNTLTQSYKNAQNLDNTVNLQEVRKSIQEFYAANGRYPADLNEVRAFNGITLKNDHYKYDPETGAITEKQ